MFRNHKRKKIMRIKDFDERNSKLLDLAREYGMSTADVDPSCGGEGTLQEAALIQRIMDGERSRREKSYWIIALASALASIFSALVAWYAVIS